MSSRLPRDLLERIATYRDRDEWLAGRRGQFAPYQIGGSDVAKVLDVAPAGWGGPWGVYAERRLGIAQRHDLSQLRDMERGRRREARVLEDYQHDHPGIEVLDLPQHLIVRHAEHPWAVVSPDALVIDLGELGGAEAKTDRYGDGWGQPETVIDRWVDGCEHIIPPHYALQVYWSLEVTGLPWWDIVVSIPRPFEFPDLVRIRIMADPVLQTQLLVEVAVWRERHLVIGEPPALDESKAMARALAQRYPGDGTKDTRDATDEEAGLVLRLAAAKAEKKAIERTERAIQNEIGALFGDTYGVRLVDGETCLWIPTAGRTSADTKRLREQFPEAADACLKEGNAYRQFRLYGFK